MSSRCADRKAPFTEILVLCMLGLAVLSAGRASAQALDIGGVVIDGPPPPVPPAVMVRDGEGRVTVRAVQMPLPVTLNGLLDEEFYGEMVPISGFVQQEPLEGEPATERTEIWVFFDQQRVYVTGRCWDSQPHRIVANEMRRDNRGVFQNDSITVVFDTFYDRRSGFFFQTNALGGLRDGLTTDEGNTNYDWNTVWQVRSRRFEQGWTFEMAIPFKSLRYHDSAPQVWGFNVRRVVRWKNETAHLTPIPASYSVRGVTKFSSAATLVGIETPGGARNLELKPYGISDVMTDRQVDPPFTNQFGGDVGVDLKYGLTRSLTLDLTYNTDFAQVESDEQQVNLTCFSLFFPEKREFFLEGQSIFEFGGANSRRGGGGRFGGSNDTPVVFFSRRIGLSQGRIVPIRAGGRVTGRSGAYTIGVLNLQSGEAPRADVGSTNYSVLRIRRDVLRRSNIGLIMTGRSPTEAGDGWNRVAGVDANFSFYDNLDITSYFAATDTPGKRGDSTSYRALLNYNGDKYGVQLERLAVGEDFNPEIGFLRRQNFRRSHALLRYSPRPRSIRVIRKISGEASFDYVTDNDGRLETRQLQVAMRTDIENGDSGRT